MSLRLRLLTTLKETAKPILLFFSQLFWRKQLSRSTSIAFLQDWIVYQKKPLPVSLPAQPSVNGITTHYYIHGEPTKEFHDDYIWKICLNQSIKSLRVCQCGIPLINNKVLLQLDFPSYAGLMEFPKKTKVIRYPMVVAPWLHPRAKYYDFVLYTLTKLCRIEEVFGRNIWYDARVCYPLLNTHFEAQFMEKLGIPRSSLINSAEPNLEVQADCLVLANTQTYKAYPSPHNLSLLRQRFCAEKPPNTGRKLYIVRRGRRQVTNDAEVQDLLKHYDFEIIADVQRTVDEQIELFQSAAVIVSPHGGALTNLLWCAPGTRVLEFFYGAYTPLFFAYLCKVLELDYSYLIEETDRPEHWTNLGHDITVDLKVLKKAVESLLR